MPELFDDNFNPGGLAHIKKDSDILWESLGKASAPFDWDKGYDVEKEIRRLVPSFDKLAVNSQNGSGSCGGQATSKAVEVKEAFATRSYEHRSAKYVIAQTYILDAFGNMLGSNMVANGGVATKQGISRETLCPSYDNGQPPMDSFMNRPQDITEAARADAKNARSLSYAFLQDVSDIDTVAQALRDNQGIAFRIVGQNNGTWMSNAPKVTQPGGKPHWGHFMFGGRAMLDNKGKKGIWALQSFGEEAGLFGWQWFGEEWFTSGFITTVQTFVFDDSVLPPAYKFTRDLTIGSRGVDVRLLQVFLNDHGSPVASSGPGSPGKETSYFGELTRIALGRFQSKNGISPAAGYFGPWTRKVVNSMQ